MPTPPPAAARSLPATLFFAAAWLVLGAAGSSRMFRDPGTFWHLLTGERILTLGLPREDWLTFTFAGKPWIAHQWLAEVAMALLRRLGGWDALLVAAAGGLALLFTWLFRRLVAAGVQGRWAVLLTALAVLTGAGSFHLRPLLLSMAFFAWTFAAIADVEAGRAPIRRLGWLLPLFVLWVNCHGAVLGGIATLGLAAAGWLLAWGAGVPSPVRGRSQAASLALIVLGAALTPLVNPYGLDMVRTWLAIVRSPVIAEAIVEHGSVWRTGAWYVLPFAALYVAVFLGAGGARWRATGLLPLVWLLLTLQRVRHAPLFAVAALLALAELLPRSHLAGWLARRRIEVCGATQGAPRLPRLAWLAPLVLLGASAVHVHAGGRSLSGPEGGSWPFALKPRLEALARAAGPGAPVLNDYVLGGFLAHELPGVRVFGDDRCELYGDEFLAAWLRGEPAWYAAWVARFDVRIALAEHGTPLDEYLRATPSWREVARDSVAALFVRGLPAGRSRRSAAGASTAPPSARPVTAPREPRSE